MQPRLFFVTPILALVLSACGASGEPVAIIGPGQTPTPEATASATATPEETAPAATSTATTPPAPTATVAATTAATPSPSPANEVARGTPAGGSQGFAATAAPNRPPPQATQTPAPATAKPVANCDPSYPTVCIPPSPPDLDCKDIPYRRFTVLPPDPHRFDGSDNDGIGCES